MMILGGISTQTEALAPPSRQGANGVRHWETGSRPEIENGGDLYELPSERDGIPRQVLVQPKPWWRGGGSQATATDAAGHVLSARAYPHKLEVVDPSSHVTTTLNRDTLDLEVQAPLQHSALIMTRAVQGTSRWEVTEKIAASGDVTVRTDHERRELVVTGAPAATAVPGVVTLLGERYEETLIPVADPISTRRYVRELEKPPVEQALPPAQVDESGVLTVFTEDGVEHEYELFIPLHAVARRS